MNIYTLRHPFEDDLHSTLNGKLLIVIIDKQFEHLNLLDATTYNVRQRTASVLMKTTHLVAISASTDGVMITTADGTLYDLIDVKTLIPTMVTDINNDSNDVVITDVKICGRDKLFNTFQVVVAYSDGSADVLLETPSGKILLTIAEFVGKTRAEALDIWDNVLTTDI